MPSSTSSSEGQLWRRTWLIALVLSLLFIGSWETVWRLKGFFPAINNNAELWALARGRASGTGPEAVILIGSSRMQVGIDPDSFSSATGWKRPLQLAIPMGPARPVLRDLAEDPSVSGRIIFGVNPLMFFDVTHQVDAVSAHYLRQRSAFTPADFVDVHLRTFTQRALVSSLPALFPQQLMQAWRTGRWPRPAHVEVDVERFGVADFRLFDGLDKYLRARRGQWKRWRGRPASPAEISRIVRDLEEVVGKIRDRNGEVIFVRMPTSGEVRKREKRLFPRGKFWDLFAEEVDAVTIHFEDHAALRGYQLPDGSHLSQADTPRFSKALGEVIVRELEQRANQ